METITATVTFTVQDRTDPDDANRAKHRHPEKQLELMDSDGMRYTFVNSTLEAEDAVRKLVEDALGLSGGVEVNAE